MKTTYRVKLNDPKKVSKTQQFKGYLAHNGDGYNEPGKPEIIEYARGQALKKARLFNGKIERVDNGRIVLTRNDIARQDLVDNCILELINQLRPDGTSEFEHDIEITGELRDVIEPILCRLYNIKDVDFYPYFQS